MGYVAGSLLEGKDNMQNQITMRIRRLAPGHYGWTMEADGEVETSSDDLESIQECLGDIVRWLPEMTAQIKVVYRDEPVGSFSAGSIIEVPEEVANRIDERYSAVVEARM
jgi:hypothetical protein